jgi:hypothetical protein
MKRTIRVGCGAGFQGDRLDPALVLAERGELDYLGLECLGERTVALAQLRRRKDPSSGYDPLLERRMSRLLPLVKKHGITLITNMGAANPLAAADAIVAIAREQKIGVKVAVVTGDDVLGEIRSDAATIEARGTLADYGEPISANAYLGIAALLPALQTGADIVVTGRVADPSLFLAPIAFRHGWSLDDFDRLARGTCVGHLLECAGQLTGGYFADPGRKDVTNMAWLGFPFADVDTSGEATFGKVDDTGGAISVANTKEQLLYEVTDPFAYLTPDVIADFSRVTLRDVGRDRVEVNGARGNGRPAQLKVSVGYHAGFVGEGEIAYAGPNAVARAKLAGAIVRERLEGQFNEMRVDLIGSTSLHGRSFDGSENPYEVRLRVAGRANRREVAALVGEEVEALYTNGPAGGGGARKYVHEQIGIVSTLIERERVRSQVTVREWSPHVATV